SVPKAETCSTDFGPHRSAQCKGVSRSAIARVEGLRWTTVERWLDRTASAARPFNHCRIYGFALRGLQADELPTDAPAKACPTWVFTTIEVWSRLWISAV